jgi:hypothetical protein
MKSFKWTVLLVVVALLALGVGPALAAPARIEIIESDPAAGTAYLFGGVTSIHYDAGTCAVKCRFTQTITNSAYGDLDQVPLPYVTGVYTKLSPEGATGTYTVCFDTHLYGQAAIYEYVDGLWTLRASVDAWETIICHSDSGNSVLGFFATGGPTQDFCYYYFDTLPISSPGPGIPTDGTVLAGAGGVLDYRCGDPGDLYCFVVMYGPLAGENACRVGLPG